LENCFAQPRCTHTRGTRYPAPLVNHLTFDLRDSSKSDKGNTCDCLLELFLLMCYDFLRDDLRFQTLQNRLLVYAEKTRNNNCAVIARHD